MKRHSLQKRVSKFFNLHPPRPQSFIALAPGLFPKYKTRLKMLARFKHSSLFVQSIDDEVKSFLTTTPASTASNGTAATTPAHATTAAQEQITR